MIFKYYKCIFEQYKCIHYFYYMISRFFIFYFPFLSRPRAHSRLNQFRNRRRPAGLVRGTNSFAGIAIEIFVKHNVIFKEFIVI